MTQPTLESVIIDKIDRIENAVIGNGQGLISRTARIEENLKSVAANAEEAKSVAEEAKDAAEERFDIMLEKLGKLVNDTVVLTESVDKHHKSEHFADMVKKPKFLLTVLAFFVVAHEIATAFGLGLADVLKIIGVR
jgi:hypothetical protein